MGHFLRGWQRTRAKVLLEYSVLATAVGQEGRETVQEHLSLCVTAANTGHAQSETVER